MTDSDALKEALLRLVAGNATDAELEIVQRAVEKDQITLATGEQAVAVGGNVNDAVIVTGDENVVLVIQGLNAEILRTTIEQFLTLRRQLADPIALIGMLHNVPALPPHYLSRPNVLESLCDLIIADVDKPTLISSEKRITAVNGMGGIGKTAIAAAFAQDRKVRFAFPDGILWLAVGRTPTINELCRTVGIALGDDPSNYSNETLARQSMQRILATKKCLLILDDVWEIHVARIFRDAIAGTVARMLITTRNLKISVILDINEYRLNLINEAEAVNYLQSWVGDKPGLHTVAEKLGYLFLALKLAGARMKKDNLSSMEYLHIFDRISRMKIDQLATDREDSLEASIILSVEAAFAGRAGDVFLYHSFGIFQEDTAIPQMTILQLWQHLCPEMDEFSLRETLSILVDLRLADRSESKAITLHDLLHSYTREKLGKRSLQTHRDLLDSYRYKYPDYAWHRVPNDGYIANFLVYHLLCLQNIGEAVALFRSDDWMKYRVESAEFTYSGYISDLEQTWESYGKSKNKWYPQVLTQQIRFAAIRSSFISTSSAYSPNLVAQAVKLKLWTSTRAINIATYVNDTERRSRMFLALLGTSILNSIETDKALNETYKAAWQVREKHKTADVICSLVNHIPLERLSSVFQDLINIPDGDMPNKALQAVAARWDRDSYQFILELDDIRKARAFRMLGPMLMQRQLVAAIQETKTFTSIEEQIRTQIKLATHLESPQQEQAFENIIEVMQQVFRSKVEAQTYNIHDGEFNAENHDYLSEISKFLKYLRVEHLNLAIHFVQEILEYYEPNPTQPEGVWLIGISPNSVREMCTKLLNQIDTRKQQLQRNASDIDVISEYIERLLEKNWVTILDEKEFIAMLSRAEASQVTRLFHHMKQSPYGYEELLKLLPFITEAQKEEALETAYQFAISAERKIYSSFFRTVAKIFSFWDENKRVKALHSLRQVILDNFNEADDLIPYFDESLVVDCIRQSHIPTEESNLSILLAKLARYLENDKRRNLLAAVFEIARRNVDDQYRIVLHRKALKPLLAISESVDHDLSVLIDALIEVALEDRRPELIEALAPKLGQHQLDHICTYAISHIDDCPMFADIAGSLELLIPIAHLLNVHQMQKAFDSLQQIDDHSDLRKLLIGLAHALTFKQVERAILMAKDLPDVEDPDLGDVWKYEFSRWNPRESVLVSLATRLNRQQFDELIDSFTESQYKLEFWAEYARMLGKEERNLHASNILKEISNVSGRSDQVYILAMLAAYQSAEHLDSVIDLVITKDLINDRAALYFLHSAISHLSSEQAKRLVRATLKPKVINIEWMGCILSICQNRQDADAILERIIELLASDRYEVREFSKVMVFKYIIRYANVRQLDRLIEIVQKIDEPTAQLPLLCSLSQCEPIRSRVLLLRNNLVSDCLLILSKQSRSKLLEFLIQYFELPWDDIEPYLFQVSAKTIEEVCLLWDWI